MQVSIALTTFNSAKYLQAQLDSYVEQDRHPDELVVSDDGSTDQTVAILEDFGSKAPFAVKLAGSSRVGLMANFGRAIAGCTGDAILLSDHDDVWLPSKVRIIAEALEDRSHVVAFSDATLVDDRLVSMGQTIWEKVRLTERERSQIKKGDALSVLLKRPVLTGPTAAFTADLTSVILPMPEWGIQDEWIGLVGACMAQMVPIEEPLVLYRQHTASQVGAWQSPVERVSIRNRYPGTYDHQVLQMQSLLDRAMAAGVSERKLRQIQGKIRHAKVRRDLSPAKVRRFLPVLREVVMGRYHRYAVGFRSAAYDLLLRQIGQR